MIQRTIKNRIRYSKYKLLLMLIGVLSAHSWTQAQNSPPTNEVMIDIDTTASWEKIKKKYNPQNHPSTFSKRSVSILRFFSKTKRLF